PRQLEAARHAAARALVRRQRVDRLAVEMHRAGLVRERAADAVDERRFAGAVGPDQPNALAFRDRKIDALKRDEAPEALAKPADREERLRHCARLAVGAGAGAAVSLGLRSSPQARHATFNSAATSGK